MGIRRRLREGTYPLLETPRLVAKVEETRLDCLGDGAVFLKRIGERGLAFGRVLRGCEYLRLGKHIKLVFWSPRTS
jgi:hypothetical protein